MQAQLYGACIKAVLPEVRDRPPATGNNCRQGGRWSAAPLSLADCTRLMLSFCVGFLLQVEKGVCEREFQALKGCMRQALRASLARTK